MTDIDARAGLPDTADISCEALLSWIAGEGTAPVVAIADLTLGAWRPQQVCEDLALQLACELPRRLRPDMPTGARRWLTFGSAIAAGIDAEAAGRKTVMETDDCCRAVGAALRSSPAGCVIVLMPEAGVPAPSTMWLELAFLARTVAAVGRDLHLLRVDPCPGGSEGGGAPVALLPGVLSEELRDVVETAFGPQPLIVFRGAHLVDPRARRPWRRWSGDDFDLLASAPALPHWVRAFAHLHADSASADEMFLVHASWRAFGEGCEDVALRFVERAVALARNDVSRAIFRTHLMGIQLALGCYAEAGAQPEGEETLPPALKAFILLAKGWGRTLSGQATLGRDDLRRSAQHRDDRAQPVEAGYANNILARAELLCGDVDAALALELDIRRGIAEGTIQDLRLKYVNDINLARIRSMRGEIELSRADYAAAFAWSRGSRTSHECVYANVCAARLADRAGDAAGARQAWLRAALHFASCEHPEALPLRYASSILGDDVVGLRTADPLDIAERLAARFVRLLGLETGAAEPPPVFLAARASGMAASEGAAVHFGPGWSVVLLRGGCGGEGREDGPSRVRLRAALARALALPCGSAASRFVVDANGEEIAGTEIEARNLARRWRVDALVSAGSASALTQRDFAADDARARFSLSHGVATLAREAAGVGLSFKRFRADARDGDPAGILQHLCDHPSGVLEDLAGRPASELAWVELLRLERLGFITTALQPVRDPAGVLTRAELAA